MATRLYLRDTQTNALQGAFRDVSTTAGTAAAGTTTAVKEGLTGATTATELQWTKTQPGGPVIEWTSAPLSGAVTIASTVTVQASAWESATQGNFGIRAKVFRRVSAGTETLVATATLGGGTATELGTTANTRLATFTATPTSTAFAATDRGVIRFYAISAGGTMGAENRAATLAYNSAAASAGDTYVEFTENFAFGAEPVSVAPAAASFSPSASLSTPAPTAAQVATPSAAPLSAAAALDSVAPTATLVATPAAATSLAATASLTTAAPTIEGGVSPTAPVADLSATATLSAASPTAIAIAAPAAASLSSAATLSAAAPTATRNATPAAATHSTAASIVAVPATSGDIAVAPSANLSASASFTASLPAAGSAATAAEFSVSVVFSTGDPVAIQSCSAPSAALAASSGFAADAAFVARAAEPSAAVFAAAAAFAAPSAVASDVPLLDLGLAAIAVSPAGRADIVSMRAARATLTFGA